MTKIVKWIGFFSICAMLTFEACESEPSGSDTGADTDDDDDNNDDNDNDNDNNDNNNNSDTDIDSDSDSDTDTGLNPGDYCNDDSQCADGYVCCQADNYDVSLYTEVCALFSNCCECFWAGGCDSCDDDQICVESYGWPGEYICNPGTCESPACRTTDNCTNGDICCVSYTDGCANCRGTCQTPNNGECPNNGYECKPE